MVVKKEVQGALAGNTKGVARIPSNIKKDT